MLESNGFNSCAMAFLGTFAGRYFPDTSAMSASYPRVTNQIHEAANTNRPSLLSRGSAVLRELLVLLLEGSSGILVAAVSLNGLSKTVPLFLLEPLFNVLFELEKTGTLYTISHGTPRQKPSTYIFVRDRSEVGLHSCVPHTEGRAANLGAGVLDIGLGDFTPVAILLVPHAQYHSISHAGSFEAGGDRTEALLGGRSLGLLGGGFRLGVLVGGGGGSSLLAAALLGSFDRSLSRRDGLLDAVSSARGIGWGIGMCRLGLT